MAIITTVSGIFGMNLDSGLQVMPWFGNYLGDGCEQEGSKYDEQAHFLSP